MAQVGVAAREQWAVSVVVVACVLSWVLGISCGQWRLVVIVLGWGGGHFWEVVVVFEGGLHCHSQMTHWGMCWLVMWPPTLLLLSLVVVVSRWQWWWVVVAVGDGDDMVGLGCF